MDWKLEVVVVPVSDVDRAKEFYADRLGFTVDTDHRAGESFRVVQVTGPDPDDRDFGSFVFFDDPDGNAWAVQQGPRAEPAQPPRPARRRHQSGTASAGRGKARSSAA